MEFHEWQTPGHGPRITSEVGGLQRFRESVTQRLRHRIDHPNLTGVIFGKRTPDRIVVLEFGPSYEHGLSHLDEIAPEGMVSVGWYRVRSTGDIRLLPDDLEIFERHFPASDALTLVAQFSAHNSLRAGYFFRENGGLLRTESSYREFVIAGPEPELRANVPSAKTAPVRWVAITVAGAIITFGMMAWYSSLEPPHPGVAAASESRERQMRQQIADLQRQLDKQTTHDRRLEALVELLRSSDSRKR
jgi:hypothetical protein